MKFFWQKKTLETAIKDFVWDVGNGPFSLPLEGIA